jgi:phosphopantothenoylcysteine decarboxylase/phosphopantothenate--cysteine ligase
MKILITSGGTKIPIDRVRSITNMSKGTFGSRIADAFFYYGLKSFIHETAFDKDVVNPIEKITFFMAKGSKLPIAQYMHNETYEDGYHPIVYVEYSTFDDYKNGIEKLLTKETYDIIVVAAAVSDYGVANYYDGKYRSREDDMCIKLVKLPKILPIMRKLAPNSVICGFKLLVDSTEDELVEAMRKQIEESDVDIVIGNDLRDIKADNHSLMVISKHNSNVRTYVQLPKDKRDKCSLLYPLAQNVVDECIETYEQRKQK